MPLPTSLLAYEADFEILDRALASERGCRVQFDTWNAAWKYRMRLNYARSLDRKRNYELHDPGHVLYGRSEYDKLSCKLRRDDRDRFWVYILPNIGPGNVEEIDADDPLIDATFAEVSPLVVEAPAPQLALEFKRRY